MKNGKRLREDPVRLNRFPESLDKVPYKDFMDGQIRVYKNGQIFRKNSRGIVEAPQHGTSRNQKYLIVSAMDDGKQKHLYVHRLLAKAFIPNPENKPHINHIDGNSRNNKLDNLEWVTPRENTAHAIKIGLITTLDNTPHECPRCLGPTMKDNEICSECNKDMRGIKRMLITKQEQRNRYRHINTKELKPLYKRVIDSRFQGLTLKEIGNELGVTREYIRQLENKVLDEDHTVFKKEVVSRELDLGNARHKVEGFKITLRASRVNADLTIQDVADAIGKTPSAVSSWETGRSKVPKDDFEELVKTYKVPTSLLDYNVQGNWVVLKEG